MKSGPMSTRSINAANLARLLGGPPATRPYYAAIAATLRGLVLDGRLPLRTRLPAERDLAAVLGVSRTTVTSAYDALRADGYVESRQGAGSWTTLPHGHPAVGPPRARRGPHAHRPRLRGARRAARLRRVRRRRRRGTAAPHRRPRLRTAGPGRPAPGDRRAVHRPRGADPARADPRDDRRAARPVAGAADPRTPRRPRPRRVADVPARARRAPPGPRPARARGRQRGLGPGAHRRMACGRARPGSPT